MVVTELVTNAVEHAGTTVTVAVTRRGTGVHLAVADLDRRFPALASPDRSVFDRGRGLMLVDALASLWGVMPTPTGKVVWATVRPGRT